MNLKYLIIAFFIIFSLNIILSHIVSAYSYCTSSCGGAVRDCGGAWDGYECGCSDYTCTCEKNASDWEVAKLRCGYGWPIDDGDACWTECRDNCCADYCENTGNHDWGVCTSGDYGSSHLSDSKMLDSSLVILQPTSDLES